MVVVTLVWPGVRKSGEVVWGGGDGGHIDGAARMQNSMG